MNLGSIIYPRVITADYILKYVRSTVNSINSNVETLYKLAGGKAEALEFIIKENSAVAGIPHTASPTSKRFWRINLQ